jgi:hypothetical protein
VYSRRRAKVGQNPDWIVKIGVIALIVLASVNLPRSKNTVDHARDHLRVGR